MADEDPQVLRFFCRECFARDGRTEELTLGVLGAVSCESCGRLVSRRKDLKVFRGVLPTEGTDG